MECVRLQNQIPVNVMTYIIRLYELCDYLHEVRVYEIHSFFRESDKLWYIIYHYFALFYFMQNLWYGLFKEDYIQSIYDR